MSRRKETARDARDRRRAEADLRNARTPIDRTRAAREGSPEYRAQLFAAVEPAPPIARPVAPVAVEPRRPRSAPPKRSFVPATDPIVDDPERSHERSRARYLRRAARPTAPRTRPSDRAPRRLTDGLKPNHAARAIPQTRPPIVLFGPGPVEPVEAVEAVEAEATP